MSTIFTKIINREIPAHIVAEDDKYIAFLDINPLTVGHTLIVPKKEVDYLFDLEDEDYTGLHLFAKKVALAQKKGLPCLRIGTVVMGLEVPHVHIHCIPMNTMDDLNFSRPKLKLTPAQLEESAQLIRKYIK